MANFNIGLKSRPAYIREGENLYILSKEKISIDDERALTLSLICNRKLFGECYRSLMPESYKSLGRSGGVMIAPFIQSSAIIPKMTFPGDLDLLIIPYDKDQLLVSKTLMIEIKIVRAKYAKQGKAPNEFGFSQAKAALANGFPFVAVAHLVTSDQSPTDSWRQMMIARVANADTGRLTDIKEVAVDMLPLDLMMRSFGRLKSNCSESSLGLLAAYMTLTNEGVWMPYGKPAAKNPKISSSTLRAIAKYYKMNFRHFMDTPKY